MLGSFALALWVTRPLITRLSEGVTSGMSFGLHDTGPLGPSDAQQLYFYSWLFLENVNAGFPWVYDPYEFGGLNPGDVQTMGLWGFPLQLGVLAFSPLGITAAMNLWVILSFPITAWVTWWVFRQLGASRLAAWAVALLFAFSLFRRTQMYAGHANGFLFVHLPLLTWFVYVAITRRSWRHGLLMGLTLAALGLGEWHMFYYSTLYVAALGIFLLWQERVTLSELRQRWKAWLGVTVPTALLWGASLTYVRWVQGFGLDVSSSAGGRGMSGARVHVPIVGRMFSHTYLFTGKVAQGKSVEMRPLYLGISVILLLLIGHALVLRKKTDIHRSDVEATPMQRLLPFFVVTFFVSLVLIYSPFLTPLYWTLDTFVPYWSYSRVTGRIFYISSLCLGGWLAYVIVRLQAQYPQGSAGHRWLLVWFFVFAVDVAALSPPVRQTGGPPPHNPVLTQLSKRALDPGTNVLVLPIRNPGEPASSVSERLVTVFRQPMLNGYSPAAPKRTVAMYETLRPLNTGGVTPAAKTALQAHHVDTILVNKAEFPADIERSVRSQLGFEVVHEDEHFALWDRIQAGRTAP